MKYLLLSVMLFAAGSVYASSTDCPSNDTMFLLRDGQLIEASSGEKIKMNSMQVVDVLSTSTEPCVIVGGSVVDVEVTTRLIQVNHSYMGVKHKTQFICPSAELKAAQCGE